MSHTLHRPHCSKTGNDDFVILVMPARGKNNTDVGQRYGQYIDIFKKYEITNMGGIDVGLLLEKEPDVIKETLNPAAPMIHAVFTEVNELSRCLTELKEKDYGFSVVVSGKLDQIRAASAKAGLKPHSFHYSLGIWGKTDALPEEAIRELTSMCGHSMISGGLVRQLLAQIKSGKKTARKAAEQLARPCLCGIFNVKKAEELLQGLAGN